MPGVYWRIWSGPLEIGSPKMHVNATCEQGKRRTLKRRTLKMSRRPIWHGASAGSGATPPPPGAAALVCMPRDIKGLCRYAIELFSTLISSSDHDSFPPVSTWLSSTGLKFYSMHFKILPKVFKCALSSSLSTLQSAVTQKGSWGTEHVKDALWDTFEIEWVLLVSR